MMRGSSPRAVLGLLVAVAFLTAAVAAPTVGRNIPYSLEGGPLTTLDVYSPGGAGHPVIVFVHGGSFERGDKVEGLGAKADGFTRQGFVVVSVNYRLSPLVRYPTHVEDVAAAIAWVHDHIAAMGGDPARLFLIGHSAGAQLAALVATDGRFLQHVGLSLNALSGVVLLDGTGYDLENTDVVIEADRERVFGASPSVWRDASPVHHVAANKGIPPFLVMYVARRDISRLRSQVFVTLLQKAGVKAILKAADKTHRSLNQELGDPGDPTTLAVLDFLRHVPARSPQNLDNVPQSLRLATVF